MRRSPEIDNPRRVLEQRAAAACSTVTLAYCYRRPAGGRVQTAGETGQ